MSSDDFDGIEYRLSGIEDQLKRIAHALEQIRKPIVHITRMHVLPEEKDGRRKVLVNDSVFVTAEGWKRYGGHPDIFEGPRAPDGKVPMITVDDARATQLDRGLTIRAEDAPLFPGLYRVKCRPVRGDIDAWDLHDWVRL